MMEKLDAMRSRAYRLLSRLYGRGLSQEDVSVARSIEVLAPHVPNPFVEDDAAADHYALFGMEVFPYAGPYLEPDGRVGGSASYDLLHLFDEAGFHVDPTAESADHLQHALSFLAFMTNAGMGRSASRRLQRRTLDGHVLPWLPPFLEGLHRQHRPFYRALGELTLDLLVDHRRALGGVAAKAEDRPLPEPPDVLGNEQAGVKDVAAFLSTPALSGMCLTRSDIMRLGREEDLPRGFGPRGQMLTNLLRSAAEYDRTEALLAALGRRLSSCRQYYEMLRNEGLPAAGPWIERVSFTEGILVRMQERLAAQAASST